LLSATMALASPVMAQDRDNMDNMPNARERIEHRVTRHHVTYRRTYKSDREEHQATEELNRQYRGISR